MIELEVKDLKLLQRVCRKLGFEFIENNTLSLYSGVKSQVDAQIRLPGWKYNVGVTSKGFTYDHWGSKPDTMKHLVGLKNEYVLTVSEKVARKNRHRNRRKTKAERPGWQFVEVYV